MAKKPSVEDKGFEVGIVQGVPVSELAIGDLLLVPNQEPQPVLSVRHTKQFVYVACSAGRFKIPVNTFVPVLTGVALMVAVGQEAARTRTLH